MKRYILILLLFLSGFGFAQNKSNKEQIQQVMKDFFTAIKEKDSTKFYSLFHDNVSWVGTYKDKSFEKIQHQNHKAKPYFSGNFREFFRSISGTKPAEEKYDNVKIIEDGNVASANFDYSFWYDNKMLNWGKEIWTLAKIYDSWKITSVVFSMEMTEYYQQPPLKQRLNKNSFWF